MVFSHLPPATGLRVEQVAHLGAKPTWHSTPGSPSSTRTVVLFGRNPHRSVANRCSTTHPPRASNSSTAAQIERTQRRTYEALQPSAAGCGEAAAEPVENSELGVSTRMIYHEG